MEVEMKNWYEMAMYIRDQALEAEKNSTEEHTLIFCKCVISASSIFLASENGSEEFEKLKKSYAEKSREYYERNKEAIDRDIQKGIKLTEEAIASKPKIKVLTPAALNFIRGGYFSDSKILCRAAVRMLYAINLYQQIGENEDAGFVKGLKEMLKYFALDGRYGEELNVWGTDEN
jgi:hypothetical protein